MGKLEARELKEKLGVKEKHVEALIRTLRKTSWVLYQTGKEFETTKQKGVFRYANAEHKKLG